MASRIVPSDPIRAGFSDEVVARLASRPNKSARLDRRLAIIGAHDERLGNQLDDVCRAMRLAWCSYLSVAFALGLFDEPHGADVRARLTGADDEEFRAAMKECMVGWMLSKKLNLNITARPEGRAGRVLEYLIVHETGGIHVEVKAPYRPVVTRSWWGDDSDLLAGTVREANAQFEPGVCNLLVLAPELRVPVYLERDQLIRAFYGEQVISVPLDVDTGNVAGPTTVQFSPDGRFLNPRNRKGKLLKRDGMPACTRVGAVLCVEEWIAESGPPAVAHQILLAHNPYATDPIPQHIWGPTPQLIDVGQEMIDMVWTDRNPTED